MGQCVQTIEEAIVTIERERERDWKDSSIKIPREIPGVFTG
jgi:hypothetical protein